jgi:uncharacterized protein YbjT (DUF2867 family)
MEHSRSSSGSGQVVGVSGATGFVGRHVVGELLARGYRVRALVRDLGKATKLFAPGSIELVRGHVHDGSSALDLARGCDAIVNLIGIIREERVPSEAGGAQTFRRMHVDATRVLVDAATSAGVGRFVQMSALGVSPDGPAEYQRTKFEGEQIVRRSGLRWTIVRPGLIHGVGGGFVELARGMCSGDAPPFFFIPYFTRFVEHEDGTVLSRISFETPRTAPVHVDDVARVFAQALSTSASVGEIYNVTGSEELGFDELMATFRDELTGTDPTLPVLGLPGTPHALIAQGASLVGLGSLLPFDAGQAYMAQDDGVADLSKLRAHLGVEPRGFRQTLATYAKTPAQV